MGQTLVTGRIEDDDDDLYSAGKSRHKEVSQFQPLSARQVKNKSGAYVWQVDDMMKLQRFIFLGTDNSFCYRVGDVEMKRENAACIDRLIGEGRGEEVVEFIRNISDSGRAAKQQPTLFALAICARCNNEKTKKAAYRVLNEVCRIPTHLFLFVKYCEQVSSGTGWGRAHKTAITNWYERKAENPRALGRLITKYRKREGWTHRDIFRLAHPVPVADSLKIVARYVMKNLDEALKLADEIEKDEKIVQLVEYLKAAEEARRCPDEDRMVELINSQSLEREHVTTQLLNSKKVWAALIKNLGMEAIIRNLGKITSMDMCGIGSPVETEIVSKLTDVNALKSARVHPFKVLLALNTYRNGKGDKGSLSWIPNPKVIEALDKAFYLAFEAVEPTKKRYLLAIDVSGSMNVPCIGSSSISCRDAAAAMMMVTARTEENYDVVAFSHELRKMDITKSDTLDSVLDKTKRIPFGGTDCALPMLWAEKNKRLYDVFIVYTDSETWYGKVHPSRALQDYRVNMQNPDAKLIVVGMAANNFTIADPDDYGMLDVVGFDSAATRTIEKFSLGEM